MPPRTKPLPWANTLKDKEKGSRDQYVKQEKQTCWKPHSQTFESGNWFFLSSCVPWNLWFLFKCRRSQTFESGLRCHHRLVLNRLNRWLLVIGLMLKTLSHQLPVSHNLCTVNFHRHLIRKAFVFSTNCNELSAWVLWFQRQKKEQAIFGGVFSGIYSYNFQLFMIYVHAKGMIVDDEYVLMGSANINQRSMAGTKDTEIAMGAYQPHHTLTNKGRHPRGQVYGYRMSLWAEHLGKTGDEFQSEGKVSLLPDYDSFPDAGGKIIGAHSMDHVFQIEQEKTAPYSERRRETRVRTLKRRRETRVRTLKRRRETRVRATWRRRFS
ncbi:unnamed protein product [Brassica oleracea var. botrytis]|uniref:phospholipase D n=1 Tax=Brassica napus TaxID=3708 RepID=A0A078HYB9_BRANA|nr:unnamed protein product [Brassica napus]CDY42882.1 BnaC08g46860D [Brassica napus]